MLGDMLGVEIHSRRTLAQAWEILQGLPRISLPTLALSTVAAAIRAIVQRGAPYQAHNALGYIRRLFNWAIGTHEFGIRASPVSQLKPKDLIGKREPRERTLSSDELRAVWQAAGYMGYPYGPVFRL